MAPEELLQKAIEKLQRQKAIKTIGLGTVESAGEFSCVLTREGMPRLFDVQYHATEISPKNYVRLKPAKGSQVIYGLIENEHTEAVILQYSEVETFTVSIDKVKFEADKEGMLLQNDENTLGKVLSDFIAVVEKIVVVSGKGPDLVKLADIKTKLESILKT